MSVAEDEEDSILNEENDNEEEFSKLYSEQILSGENTGDAVEEEEILDKYEEEYNEIMDAQVEEKTEDNFTKKI